MKAKIIIYAVAALLAAGTIFHVSTGSCPLKQIVGESKACPIGK